MKKKKTYDITHRVIRVEVDDYAFIKAISQSQNIPIAEALHLILMNTALDILVKPHPAQIEISFVTPAITVNGSKAAAFASKPKGVKYE